MKRKFLILGLALVAGGVLAGSTWFGLRPGSHITKANFGQLTPGMSLAQVEEILGGPARDESSAPLLARVTDIEATFIKRAGVSKEQFAFDKVRRRRTHIGLGPEGPPPEVLNDYGYREWISNTAIIMIDVTPDFRVYKAGMLAVHPRYQGPWATLRRCFWRQGDKL